MLQRNGYIWEGTQVDDDILELEIYIDDITKFMIIPKQHIDTLEQYYTILSFSPQLKDIDGETFASLVLKLKWKGANQND